MGNAESSPASGRKSKSRLIPQTPPPNRGQVQDFSNRYASPFNRTQFSSHSAADPIGNIGDERGSGRGLTVFGCLTDETSTEDDEGLSCLSIQHSSTGIERHNNVRTVYDVHTSPGRQISWEYQRYVPSQGWGAAHFSADDLPLCAAGNVRFAAQTLELFGASLAEVSPVVPQGWAVDEGWAIVVQRRIRKRGGKGDVDETAMSDRFGWHYGSHLRSADDQWVNTHQPGCDLRRRAWSRLLVQKGNEGEGRCNGTGGDNE